ERWYFKVEPPAVRPRNLFQQYLSPGTCCAIDESMAKTKGRVSHRTKAERKPTEEGYKLLQQHFSGYVGDFFVVRWQAW
ncbi:hypothetical protein BJ508DRAFT_216558, partial [Ascobolus immersus RN42]